MRRTRTCLVPCVRSLALCLCFPLLAPSEQLTPSKPQLVRLGVHEIHEYTIALKTGQAAEVEIERQGIVTAIEILDPSGKSLAWVVDPISSQSAPRRIAVIANQDGEYGLRISPQSATAAGDYWISLLDVHPAKAMDNARWDFQLLFSRPPGQLATTPYSRFLGKNQYDLEDAYPKAMALLEKTRDNLEVADLQLAISELYRTMDSSSHALRAASSAVQEAETAKSPERLMEAWLLQQPNCDAITCIEKSMSVIGARPNPFRELRLNLNLADIVIRTPPEMRPAYPAWQEGSQKVIPLLGRALAIAREHDYGGVLPKVLADLGIARRLDFAASIALLNDALKGFQANGSMADQAPVWLELGRTYESNAGIAGNPRRACKGPLASRAAPPPSR